MKHEQKSFFKEKEDPSVPKGFTVLETDEDSQEYRIGELWEDSTPATPKWVSYWMQASELNKRLSADKCEYVGQLTDEQFEQVVEKVGDERVVVA